jgi:hypothetical protein
MMARKAETYSPETQVINLAELRQIIWELSEEYALSFPAN